jgi:hypothetical protein
VKNKKRRWRRKYGKVQEKEEDEEKESDGGNEKK